jgi:uncharacterized protein YgbK (DUF1537 family)
MSGSVSDDPGRLDGLIRADGRRVIVLDDDPTGTQTVSGLDVLLVPGAADLDTFFRSPSRALYVLTNTRAMPRDEAAAYLRRVVDEVDAAAERAGARWIAVLRGDSTLRGHVFAEADVLGAQTAVLLFVPAFPEGGRTTVGGVQLVEIDGKRCNAADTEFATDTTFGYTARDLVSWVAETGGGRSALMVTLDDLRERGPAAIADAIGQAAGGTVVIPEAETVADLRSVAVGFLEAEARGARVVIRSASSFAALLAGSLPRQVDPVIDSSVKTRRILIVCGSHTAASTAQLVMLHRRGLSIVEVDASSTTDQLVGAIRDRLDTDGVGVLATPRSRSDDGSLRSGASMMDRLCDVIERLRDDVDAVIAKGGITSAAVAISLGARVARVEGQVAPGIALWRLRLDRDRSMPYVVIPGNVGGPDAIAAVLDRMRPDIAPGAVPTAGRS